METWGKSLNLKSSVESLTQRRREAESAEKVQKSDGKKKNMTRRISEIYFTQLVKTNTCSSNGITSANSASPRLCVRYNMEW